MYGRTTRAGDVEGGVHRVGQRLHGIGVARALGHHTARARGGGGRRGAPTGRSLMMEALLAGRDRACGRAAHRALFHARTPGRKPGHVFVRGEERLAERYCARLSPCVNDPACASSRGSHARASHVFLAIYTCGCDTHKIVPLGPPIVLALRIVGRADRVHD